MINTYIKFTLTYEEMFELYTHLIRHYAQGHMPKSQVKGHQKQSDFKKLHASKAMARPGQGGLRFYHNAHKG